VDAVGLVPGSGQASGTHTPADVEAPSSFSDVQFSVQLDDDEVGNAGLGGGGSDRGVLESVGEGDEVVGSGQLEADTAGVGLQVGEGKEEEVPHQDGEDFDDDGDDSDDHSDYNTGLHTRHQASSFAAGDGAGSGSEEGEGVGEGDGPQDPTGSDIEFGSDDGLDMPE
jgi:hypothetical protein